MAMITASILFERIGTVTIVPRGILSEEKYVRYSFCNPFCMGMTVAIYISLYYHNLAKWRFNLDILKCTFCVIVGVLYGFIF